MKRFLRSFQDVAPECIIQIAVSVSDGATKMMTVTLHLVATLSSSAMLNMDVWV